MRLEDFDYDALINQMWGSEVNLRTYLDSEVPRLCSRICGADAPVPIVKVTYPPLKGEAKSGIPMMNVSTANTIYQLESENAPATIFIPAIFAGYKAKLPQFISLELVHHWEVLGGIGEDALEYSQAPSDILKRAGATISEDEFKELYSPRFIAKAFKVARDLEVALDEFLFPKISLTVTIPVFRDEQSEST